MGYLAMALLVGTLILVAAKMPLWIVGGERPTDRPREWPVGVQESDRAGYAVREMPPREPPDRPEPVATEPVAAHVEPRGR